MVLANAFSVGMLPHDCDVAYREIQADTARKLLQKFGVDSHIGHIECVERLSQILGVEIPFNRLSAKPGLYETILVAQRVGDRLELGEKVDNAADYRFWLVQFRPCHPADYSQDPIIQYVQPVVRTAGGLMTPTTSTVTEPAKKVG